MTAIAQADRSRGADAGTVIRFSVMAQPDSQTLPRVINFFAQLGLVPTRVQSEVEGERMTISIEHRGLDPRRAAVIAEKMRSSVLVETVELSDIGSARDTSR